MSAPITSSGWCRLYRAALVALPRALREKHGEAMVALYARELIRAGSTWERATVTMVAIADVLRRAPYEWMHLALDTRQTPDADERREPLPPVRAVDVMRRLMRPFTVAFTVFTTAMLANYADQRALDPSAQLEQLLLAVPFTAALTVPAALFVAVALSIRQLRRATGSPVMPQGLRRAVLLVSSGVAAFMLVFTAVIVPRANQRLQSAQVGHHVPRNDRSMTIVELQRAAASLRAGVIPVGSTQAAHTLRIQEVSYRVEIQKKLVLTVSCIALALAALALGWHFARANAAVLVAASLTLCVMFVVSIMAGEAVAEALVVPPAISMWAGTAVVLLMTLPALRSKRAIT
jgi:hypothetical protein